MDKIFYPHSIAVIGVSERPDNLAANIVRNVLALGCDGDVYAVGRRSGEVWRIPIGTSVGALPDLLDAYGQKGIRQAAIEPGGSAEFSKAGRDLEDRVSIVARRRGIRFVGPNCISVVNAENRLCLPSARLDPEAVKPCLVSVLAQSGGVSVTCLILLSEAGLGANKVVSTGNKAGLDEMDYLDCLLNDPGTEIVRLYLEGIEEGRRLLELVASSAKPVIVQKANTGATSAGITFSHTAALANDDRISDAALRQSRVARAASFNEAVALAQRFALPPVGGDDLLIISRSGGLGRHLRFRPLWRHRGEEST
ncbi:MAG: CoA-binding protein [Anaerolineae bacterium]